MKAKLLFISALMSLMTSGISAQKSVLNEMRIDVKETAIYDAPYYYTSDIDSIVFSRGRLMLDSYEKSNIMTLYGNNRLRESTHLKRYDISNINSIEFSFRDSRKLISPKFGNCGVISSSKGNSIWFEWEPIEGAIGYEIKYFAGRDGYLLSTDFFGNGEFELWLEGKHPSYKDIITDPIAGVDGGVLIVSKDITSFEIHGLEYDTAYTIAIRALSPDGEEFHSDWGSRYEMGRYWTYGLRTLEHNVPKLLSNISRTEDYVRVGLNLAYDAHVNEDLNNSFVTDFEIVDGKFVADEIWVRGLDGAEVPAKWAKYKLTAVDIANGYIDIDGLEGNGALYSCTIVNTNVESVPDSKYNTITFAKKESFGAPVLIPHKVDPESGEYNACRIDTILNSFMNNDAYDDGIFYLEGGKTYYIAENVDMTKGLTLETNPEDVASGKRAIVYMPHTSNTSSNQHYYFMIGKNLASTDEVNIMEPITFRNIDFDCPGVRNYGETSNTGEITSGNYFINTYSLHEPFVLKSLNIESCEFQRFIRGFVRLQGPASAQIDHINCDGNIFYNCGYYSVNANDYGFFVSAGTANVNLYSDFRFLNNTIYDSPKRTLIWDNNKIIAWSEDTKWNITIENNTFINFSTRANSKYFIEMRYVPDGSHFSLQRNLFVLAKNDDDARDLYNSGVDIRNGNFTFDIKDNYSVGCLDSHMKDDGIFTSGAFSATKNSFGAFPDGNKGTAEDLIVKVGTTPLKATDLFTNPNPPYNQVLDEYSGNDHKAPVNIMEALKYRQTPEVLNHEIYTKNIGDQRWK